MSEARSIKEDRRPAVGYQVLYEDEAELVKGEIEKREYEFLQAFLTGAKGHLSDRRDGKTNREGVKK